MSKIGVVFSNLGTPRGPEPKDVGEYLKEFLQDPYVIQIPGFLRFLLVRGIIVPFRKKKSAANYQKVWTQQGSPLLVETKKAARALQEKLGEAYQVVVGMRYGEPNFQEAKEKLKNCEEVIFFPQYPHYAESSSQTGIDQFKKYFADKKYKIIESFFEDPNFIQAYADFLKEEFKKSDHEHLIMSYHGLPESHIQKLDPSKKHCLKVDSCCDKASADVLKTCYRAQCYRTSRLIAEKMGLSDSDYSVAFQSRLGREKWIEPYTDFMYEEFPKKGLRKLAVICPGFPVDGLETLEEVAISGKESFMEAGGESFTYIPCLNDYSPWIDACARMIKDV